MSDKIIIKKILKQLYNHESVCFSFSDISVSDYTNTEIQQVINEETELFFKPSKTKIILVIQIYSELSKLFESCNFCDLDFSSDIYDYIRTVFGVTAFNKKNFSQLLHIDSCNRSLSYADFSLLESSAISIFNDYSDIQIETKTENQCFDFDKDIISDLRNQLVSQRHIEVLNMRSDKMTLNDIGLKYFLSRERVRQLENTPTFKICKWFERYSSIFIEKCMKNNVISDADGEKFFGQKEWKAILYVITNNKNIFTYDQILKILILDPHKKYFNILKQNIKINAGITARDHCNKLLMEMHLNGFSFFSYDNALTEYSENNYRIYKNVFYDSTLNLGKAISSLVKSNYPSGVDLSNEKNLKIFADELNFIFNLKVKPTRALYIRAQNILISKGDGVFTQIDNVIFPKTVRKKIYDYIDDCPGTTISFKSLYLQFKELLVRSTNINNEYFLRGILKYYEHENQYIFSKMYLSHKLIQSQTKTYHQIRDYLIEAGKPVNKSVLKEKYDFWNDNTIKYINLLYPEIVLWNDDTIINLNVLNIDSASVKILQSLIEKMIQNKLLYTNIYLIENKIKEIIPEFLEKYNIENINQLFHIIQFLFPNDFFYRIPHILSLSRKVKSYTTDDLLTDLLNLQKGNIKSKPKLFEDIKQYFGEKNSSIHFAVKSVFKDYLKISENDYVKISSLNINEEKIKKIEDVIEANMIDGKVLMPNTIFDYSVFPNLGCEWSSWLLCSIVLTFSKKYFIVGTLSFPSKYPLVAIVVSDFKKYTKKQIFKWLVNNRLPEKENLSLLAYSKKINFFHSNLTTELLNKYLC